MEGFSVKIIECSKEMSTKERVNIKDTTSAIKLDGATQVGDVIIHPDFYAILGIHNEKSDSNKDYENYVIVDVNGDKYVTGSKSFWSSFKDIYDEMEGEEEEWGIKVFRHESKNYKGKDFITCSII